MKGKPRILIVDDDHSTRKSLTLIFQKKGYDTETVSTGREALEKAQGRFFNLVLLDIRLPDGAGVELIAPLKEMHPDMAVIMITAYASLGTAVRAMNQGASAYINKPLNMHEVLATVGEVLEKQRLVMDNAQLLEAVTKHREELQRLSTQLIHAQEAERKRISQELHDEMGQALTAMSINLSVIEKEMPPQLTLMIGERLEETAFLVDQTLEQVRELALNLRPSMLDDLGLLPTLRWYVGRYAKRLSLKVELEAIDLEERLPREMETVLYRMVQEALTNIAKHAQASSVHIRMEGKDSTVSMAIEDNGRGFDTDEVEARERSERGAGLLGMRERISNLGGSLSIRSRPGQGTHLSAELPLDTEADHEENKSAAG